MDKYQVETLFKNRLRLRLTKGYTPEGSTVPTLSPHPNLTKLSVDGSEKFYAEAAEKIANLSQTQGMNADSLIDKLVDQFTDPTLRTSNPSKATVIKIGREKFDAMFEAAVAEENRGREGAVRPPSQIVGRSKRNPLSNSRRRIDERLLAEQKAKQQAMDSEPDPLRRKMIELFDNPNVPLEIGTKNVRDLIGGNVMLQRLQRTNPERANAVVQEVLVDICNNVHVGLFSSQDTRSKKGVKNPQPMQIPASLAHNVIKSGHEDEVSVEGEGDAYVKTLLDRKIAAVINPPRLFENKGEEIKPSPADHLGSLTAQARLANIRGDRVQRSVDREAQARQQAMANERDLLKRKLLELGFDGNQRVEIATTSMLLGNDTLQEYIDKQPELAALRERDLGAANRVRESIVADIASNITAKTFATDTRTNVEKLVMSPETLAGLIKYQGSNALVQTDIKEDNGIDFKTRSLNIKELLAGKVAEEIGKDARVQQKNRNRSNRNQNQNRERTSSNKRDEPAVTQPAQNTPANTAATVTQVEPQDPLTDNVLAAMAKANQQAKPKQMMQGLALEGKMKVAKVMSVISRFDPTKFFKKTEEAKVTTPPATPATQQLVQKGRGGGGGRGD